MVTLSAKNTNTEYVLLELKAYGRLGSRALVAHLGGWLAVDPKWPLILLSGNKA